MAAVLSEAGIDVAFACLEWFMALYTTSLPTATALRVWDTFLLEGNHVLFRVALALFWLNRDAIVAARGQLPVLFNLLRDMPLAHHDADELIQTAFPDKSKLRKALKLKWAGLTNAALMPLRLKARAAILADMEETVVRKVLSKTAEPGHVPDAQPRPSSPREPPAPPPARALSSAALSASPPASRASRHVEDRSDSEQSDEDASPVPLSLTDLVSPILVPQTRPLTARRAVES